MEKQECEPKTICRGSRVNEVEQNDFLMYWELKLAQIDEYDLIRAQHGAQFES